MPELTPALAHPLLHVVDGAGRAVDLSQPARRVVTLTPHATELIYALGAGDALVGTVDNSDYPAPALNVPHIGNGMAPDLERIVSVHPDLVVIWGPQLNSRSIQRLLKSNIKVYVSDPHTLNDIGDDMTKLGALLGADAAASIQKQHWQAGLLALSERYSQRLPVTVFYQAWPHPLYTVNDHQVIGAAIRLCGGTNLFGKLKALAPIVDIEAVIAANPDVIVATGNATQLDLWQSFPSLKAVQRQHAIALHPDLLSRPTPRMLSGITELCETIDQARH
jgi:iron complex transport system substrate-binding protein